MDIATLCCVRNIVDNVKENKTEEYQKVDSLGNLEDLTEKGFDISQMKFNQVRCEML